MELTACEAEMTDMDWEGLIEMVIAVLAISNSEILAET